MTDKDLEKTTTLDSLDELIKQEKNNFSENPKSKKEKKQIFLKIKKWWKNLSKKKKVIIIISLIVLLIIVSLGIFFFVKSFKKEEVVEIPKEDVIVEQENYRYENGNLLFYNDNNDEIGKYECINKDPDLCFVAFYSTEDNFDIPKKLNEDETPLLERVPIINNNFVFINDNKKDDETIKIYNIEQKNVLKETTRLVKKADNVNKKFILKNNTSNYGIVEFVDNNMAEIIPFNYDYLGFIATVEDYYISLQMNRSVIINSANTSVSKGINGEIKGLTKKYIKIIDDFGKYRVFDYDGKEVFNNYDYIELYDQYAALINDNKLNLKFYDGAKLNEEEIALNNVDYLKTDIYDDEQNIKETRESFLIEEKGDYINVNIKNQAEFNKVKINKNEGLRSKTLKYINYFDGKLYFYRNQEKTDLIGVYTCNNKNVIKNEKSELANCYLARDTIYENNELETPGNIGFTPLFNDRYIFIADEANKDSKTISLYDLKTNKVISKYQEINTYSYTGIEELSFKNINDLQIVAKNKDNQFGVIKLDNNEIKPHIPFNYNYIEKIGDYYSAKNESGYLLLDRNNGASLFETAISGVIKNYNDKYVIGIENEDYYVYNHENKKLNRKGYAYIALYPTFFAAVSKDNKLGLYTYDKPEVNFLKKEIGLNLKQYYGNGTLAFKVYVVGKKYTVDIGTEENTYVTKMSGAIPGGK